MLLAWYIENHVISVNGSYINSAMHVEKYLRTLVIKKFLRILLVYHRNSVILVIHSVLKDRYYFLTLPVSA